MEDILEVASALSDRTRLRLLLSLRDRELCACQLVEFIGLADSTVSRHMSILKSAGLVDSRKSGRWVYYKLSKTDTQSVNQEILDIVLRSIADDPLVAQDAKQIAEILARGGENACASIPKVSLASVSSVEENNKQLEHQN